MLSNIDFGSYFHTKKYEKGLSTGGDKIADWGGSKGGWGGHVPPSLYVKRGPDSAALCVEQGRRNRVMERIHAMAVERMFLISLKQKYAFPSISNKCA